MVSVTMYGTRTCSFCRRAEECLRRKGVTRIDKTLVDMQPGSLDAMISRTGRRTVPQIFVGAVHVGGYDDLVTLDRSGRLDELLAA